MEYRADKDSDVWHFCPTCPNWPETPFNVIWLDEPPALLKICPDYIIKLLPGVTAPSKRRRRGPLFFKGRYDGRKEELPNPHSAADL
jgi:hypothetical protein